MTTNNLIDKLVGKKVTLLAIACSVMAMNANADLYVSPVTKDSASVNYVNNVVSGAVPLAKQNSGFGGGNNPSLSRTGNLFAQALRHDNSGMITQASNQGGFGMSVYNQKPVILMNQGKDIPLSVAIENIVPEISSWMVHYDKGIHNLDMTWSGGDTWEGVLYTLGEQNEIKIEINHAERVIGVGKDLNIAKHLAKKVPTVWRVDTSLSLRENLESWSEKVGWSLAWDEDLRIDYPVNFDATFTGELVGKSGAVDLLLSSYKSADIPLKAKFFKKNKVVFVTRGGFEQELQY